MIGIPFGLRRECPHHQAVGKVQPQQEEELLGMRRLGRIRAKDVQRKLLTPLGFAAVMPPPV
jgi:hypothetical protein